MLIDLSHQIESGMTTYPGLPGPVVADYLGRVESRDHYAPGTEFHIAHIEMVANTGTYLDTPAHRFADGFDLSGLPLSSVADLPGVCVAADGPAIHPEAFASVDVAGKAVLFFTGWDEHWRTHRCGDPDHPFLTEDTARWLVESGASLAGIDSVNIDDTSTGHRPVHSTLLRAGVPIVEHLTGLVRVAGSTFRFFAVPPRVVGMGTFPVRAFAILE